MIPLQHNPTNKPVKNNKIFESRLTFVEVHNRPKLMEIFGCLGDHVVWDTAAEG